MFQSFKKTNAGSFHTPGEESIDSLASWDTPVAEPVGSASTFHSSAYSTPTYTPPSSKSQHHTTPRGNVLNSDVEVEGILKFQDDLLIDGQVNGKIFSEAMLTVGENAIIQAEIKSQSVIIHGKVTGNITASDRVELRSTAQLIGNITAGTFSVEPGAVYVGQAAVGAQTKELVHKPIQSSPVDAILDDSVHPDESSSADVADSTKRLGDMIL